MAELNREALQAFVQDNYMPMLSDNIFESSNFLKYIMSKTEKKGGGRNFVISPILYDKTGAAGAVSGFGDVDINPNKKWTAVEYDYRTFYAAIAMSFDERDAAEGDPNAIMSWLEKEMKVAKLTIQDILGEALFNDGSDTELPHGLRLVNKTDRELGDIDSTSYPWWDGNLDSDTTNYTKANLVDPTSAYYCLTTLRSSWNAAKHNNDKPDVIGMTAGWEGVLEEELFPYTRYGNGDDPANVEFEEFKYRKKAPMIQDDLCPDGWLFMVNTNWFFPVVHRARNFKVGPFQEPSNKLDALVSKVSIKMNFASNGPRMQAAIQAASALG